MKGVEMRNFFITKRIDVGPRLLETSLKQRVTPTSSTQFFLLFRLEGDGGNGRDWEQSLALAGATMPH